MKKTKVAVRERVTDPITRPPLAYRSVRLSPVPVLPPTTIAVPSAARKLWLARRAVPLSTVSTSARRTTAALSGRSTRTGSGGSAPTIVSYGPSDPQRILSTPTVRPRHPLFPTIPLHSPHASRRPPHLATP